MMLFFVMDVDGTILNSEHLYFEYMAQAVGEVLGSKKEEEVREFMSSKEFVSYYGMGDREILDALLEGEKVEEVYGRYLKKVEENAGAIISRSNFVKGFERFLTETDEPFGLVSSSHRQMLTKLTSLLPRQPLFMITGDDVEKHKPHPEPYLKAKEKIPVEHTAVVFEDALAGRESALSAGFKNVVCIRTCYWEPCFEDWDALLDSGFLKKL